MKTLMILLALSTTACSTDPVSTERTSIVKPTGSCSGTLRRSANELEATAPVTASGPLTIGQCSLDPSPNASSLASTAP